MEKIKIDDRTKIEIIINAAQRRFGKYGLAKTTMNEIATDIGMGKASLYYYFPDKEALFQAVIGKELSEFLFEMNRMIDSNPHASFQLAQYVKLRNEYFKKFLNLSKLKTDAFFQSKPIFGKVFEDFYKNEIDLVKTIIQKGVDTEVFRKINTHEYAELFIHIMQGLRLIRIKNKDIADLGDQDYVLLENETSKVVDMFIKDFKASSNSVK